TSAEPALGKADDYLGILGREYDLTATLEVRLEGDDLELDAEARRALAESRAHQLKERVSRALDSEIWKQWPMAQRSKDQAIVLRLASDEIQDLLEGEPGVFSFSYLVEVGGPNDLLERYPFEREDSARFLV